MLACIACTKEGGDDTARPDTPRVKSLTSQIKDMVLKLSGSSRQCKGGGNSSVAFRSKGSYRRNRHHGHHRSAYSDAEDDVASDGGGGSRYGYLRAGSSSSTPAWDFTSIVGPDTGKSHWVSGAGAGRGNEGDVVVEDSNGEAKEWTALVEPGVQITFMSLPRGSGNDLKRIRFSREMFNKWQAQRWWGENFERIMELYNVQKFSQRALPTPPRSEDREPPSSSSPFLRVGSTRESRRPQSASSSRAVVGSGSGGGYLPSVPDPSEHIMPHHLFHHHVAVTVAAAAGNVASVDASRTTTSSRDEAASISISNASDLEVAAEWVEEDEPGVYITIRECPDGNRELRRVRFSRERFGEVHAKLWWEDNRERIQAQYL